MLLKPVVVPAIINYSKFSFSTKVNWLNNNNTQVQRRRRIAVAVEEGGYSKKSLDTYEPVDEETGDDNKQLLLQLEPPASSKASSKGVSPSFQRLRVGKVRDLSRVSSSEKDKKHDNSRTGSLVMGQDETLLARFNNFSTKLRKSNATSDFYSRKSFKDVGCADYMLHFLNTQLLANPSHIQAMSFPHVINGKSCIIADQSGSGKTLAYLLPVIQCLRQDELQGIAKSLPGSPRVVILVPTAELASQVLRNCRLMSKSGVPFRSMIATGGFKQKTQLESLRNELDVLIATPGRFLYLVEEGFLQLTNLKWYLPYPFFFNSIGSKRAGWGE
ncbi:DEAD-box ATP-dependent RNA helicase 50 [Tanacetum coccineum]|uniref:DEAD-box ATP-dependent RNA helicase 50 n=1 Tax=Tanacetum coccineum TaxID=301880 RepID=A0ABQ5I4Z2_9ASTR